MQVQQKHVTYISLHDGRERNFVVYPEDGGYKLSFVSRDDIVHIQLSPRDLQQLGRVLERAAMTNRSAPAAVSPERSADLQVAFGTWLHENPAPRQSAPEWIAFN